MSLIKRHLNLLILIFFSMFGFFITVGFLQYYLIETPLSEAALRRAHELKSHQSYSEETSHIGRLPSQNIPSSYLHFPEQKSPNKIRLGFFGDSHTDNTENLPGFEFPFQLQKMLGDRYEVLNFALSGYNSNQIYLMIKYFASRYQLDQIFLGPRGFYTYRAASFNNYWNQGEIPQARLEIERDSIAEWHIEGESHEERIENYYSFFPTYRSLFYDQSPPGFLKLIDRLFSLEVTNPFAAQNTSESRIRDIQVKSIQSILSLFSGKVIHYTDFEPDCEVFQAIEHPRYQLYCATPFVVNFPYLARISHPSSFGHFVHARNIYRIIENDPSWNRSDYTFQDDESHFLKNPPSSRLPLGSRQIFVKMDSKLVGKISPSQKILDRTGRLSPISQNMNSNNHDIFFLAIYQKDQTRAGSLILEVPMQKHLHTLKTQPIEYLSSVSNFGFLAIPSINIYNRRGVIATSSEKLSLPDSLIYDLFDKYVGSDGIEYRPKNQTFRFVIDENVDPLQILPFKKHTVQISFHVM